VKKWVIYTGIFIVLAYFISKRENLIEYVENDEIFSPLLEILSPITSVFDRVENMVVGTVEKIVCSFDDLYQKYAAYFGIDWRLIKAVVLQESNENSEAVGDNGRAVGLMQLWSYHWGEHTREEMFDPEINIEQGTKFLSYLVKKWGVNVGIQMFSTGEQGYLNGVRAENYLNGVLGNLTGLA
jgi:hypothetical protein